MARRLLRATLLAPVTGMPLQSPEDTTVFLTFASWSRARSTTRCRGRYSGAMALSIFHSDGFSELVQSEDRFTEVKDALKQLCKVDLDKLISSVRVRIKPTPNHPYLRPCSWLRMRLVKLVQRGQPPHG